LDPLLVKLANDADTIYGAKEILSSSDWLACHKEEGQPFENWLNNPKRNEVNKAQSKIYLNIIDISIGVEFQQALHRYCSAFYTGMEVVLMAPEEGFMEKHKIESRIHWDTNKLQYNASTILTKTIP
jgi:hypothetical protein